MQIPYYIIKIEISNEQFLDAEASKIYRRIKRNIHLRPLGVERFLPIQYFYKPIILRD
jgi:hypothetical protein